MKIQLQLIKNLKSLSSSLKNLKIKESIIKHSKTISSSTKTALLRSKVAILNLIFKLKDLLNRLVKTLVSKIRPAAVIDSKKEKTL